MKRVIGVVIVGGLVLALLLAGCGGDDPDEDDPAGGAEAGEALIVPTARATPAIPPSRYRDMPPGDPYTFEAPFSAGNFVQQRVRGRPAALETGGLQAIYRRYEADVYLTMFYFPTEAEAVRNVHYILDRPAVAAQLGTPYFSPPLSFNIAQNRQGDYLAVWSNERWFFLVQTPAGLETLQQFLDSFPY